MILREEIAARLTLARKTAGLERSEAAEAMGIPYQTYASHENGSRTFDVEAAVLYGRRFKVSLDWLLTGSGRGPGGDRLEPKITNETQVLAMLARIEGLSDTDINVARSVIMNALTAKRVGSTQGGIDDQPQSATPRHEVEP